jgi:hypothetical protein
MNISDIDPVYLNTLITLIGIHVRVAWTLFSWLRNRRRSDLTCRLAAILAETPTEQRVAAIGALADLERARRRLW